MYFSFLESRISLSLALSLIHSLCTSKKHRYSPHGFKHPARIFKVLDPLPFAIRIKLPRPEAEVHINIDNYVYQTQQDTNLLQPDTEIPNPSTELPNPQIELPNPSQQKENPELPQTNQG